MTELTEQIVYFDGRYMPLSEARIPILDHAVLYGDGVFEGIREYDGNIFRLDQHLDRLYSSAESLMIRIPVSKDEMAKIVAGTCAINHFNNCYLRLVVTRGGDKLGVAPNNSIGPRIFCVAQKVHMFSDEIFQHGLHAKTSSFRRNNATTIDPQIKSLNYLNNVRAVLEAKQVGCDEAIMLTEDGLVTEGSGDNIFIVKNRVLITPPVWVGTLDGITRRNLLECAKNGGYDIREEPFTLTNMYSADEVFLTGTMAEIIALTEIDGHVIGRGKAGIVTTDVLRLFRDYVKDPAHGYKVDMDKAEQYNCDELFVMHPEYSGAEQQ